MTSAAPSAGSGTPARTTLTSEPAAPAAPGTAGPPHPRGHNGASALPGGPGTPDPLDDPDARAATDAAAVECLLRCWVRERDLKRPDDGVLRIPLPATHTSLDIPVRHWSAAGWHRFGAPVPTGCSQPVDAVTLVALLAREVPEAPAAARADTVARVADSAARSADFVRHRRTHPEPPPGTTPFLAGEQALLLGHPLHPVPKARDGLTSAESLRYSPELRGSFPLHWFAARADAVHHDSSRTDSALDLVAELAFGLGLDVPDGYLPVPVHPWQARDLVHRPETVGLFATGVLRDLGPAGPLWYPTSSVRTLYRADARIMLKTSLGLRITNSKRGNLRKELLRGVEVDRLMCAGLAAELHEVHPQFDIVRDPAWLAVDPRPAGDGPENGLELVVRENPFTAADDVTCVAGLAAERPGIGPSRLARLVHDHARRTGWSTARAAEDWYTRYLAAVADPILWLDTHAGIALESHQQNTLVVLDADGLPTGARYRDNQGYYFRASRAADLEARLPGAGRASDTVVDDAVADERFAYYLGVNNLLGLVGALGSQGLADETTLLRRTHDTLEAHAATNTTAQLLLRQEVLRCKGNLLTRLHGLDELVGPVATQSVYVAMNNPLHAHH